MPHSQAQGPSAKSYFLGHNVLPNFRAYCTVGLGDEIIYYFTLILGVTVCYDILSRLLCGRLYDILFWSLWARPYDISSQMCSK